MGKATSHRRPAGASATRAKSEPAELSALTPLNFKVASDFHREFKTFAAQHGKKMVEVLQEGFVLLKEKYGHK
ncbi:MAG TPA: hypothetical protein VD837_07155 [Terriglobales bacterium]|nr:hypothetical protein [Terriglobales bacterium]